MNNGLTYRKRDDKGRLMPMDMPTCSGISYAAIHMWVKRRLGKASFCTFDVSHQAKRYEWASKSHRNLLDLYDYFPLCPSCHRKYDFTEETRRKLQRRNICNDHKQKAVTQINKSGMRIATFKSLKIASEQTGICRTAISNNLAGRAKSAGGYLWKEEVHNEQGPRIS